MKHIVEAIEGRAARKDFACISIPETYRALTTHKADVAPTRKVPVDQRDPCRTLHLDHVPVPELAPDEALIAVMASAINYNTVWSSVFEPVSTFSMIERYAARNSFWKRHDLPYHQLGSDAAGVVLRIGAGVSQWHPGDRVVVHGAHVDLEGPGGHGDSMLDPSVVAWGFETNFGGLGELAVAKAHQLLPKPEHLTWEEAASNGVTNSTMYRQLVSTNGAAMKVGDVVLIWGASSGLGSYAVQYALRGGALPIAVVSGPRRAKLVRDLGCEWVIDRETEGFRLFDDERPNPREMKRFGERVRQLTGGEDPNIVIEHVGRHTFATSVFVASRGGCVVTCGSTTGHEHVFDNRHLWLGLKRIVGTHIANLREAAEANRLVRLGRIHPTVSRSFPLDQAGTAARIVQRNEHDGKIAILCLSPEEGRGVTDRARRSRHEVAINLFRRASTGSHEVHDR